MKHPDFGAYLRGALQSLLVFVLAVIICGIVTVCCSCTRKVYVPVEKAVTHTDTLYQAKLRVDSVIFRDSVAVIQKGDTVFMTKWRDRFRYSERIDTVYQVATDSVDRPVPYPVERKLTGWEQTKMNVGGFAIAGCVILFVASAALAAWLVFVKRRK